VRIATRLAATADRGTILVSESAYDRLRAHHLFRRRGAFYVEQLGELTTYVLRGRL
jgi:adenylate cyclase